MAARLLLTLLAATLLAAGCGGSTSTDTSGSGGASSAPAGTAATGSGGIGPGGAEQAVPGSHSADYQLGVELCTALPQQLLAQQEGVANTAKAVADAVTKDLSSKRKKQAIAGCLAALKSRSG